MKIISSSSKGNYKVTDAQKEVCEVTYQNWFSSKATTVFKGHTIELSPKNIWTSKVIITKDGAIIGDITFNLKAEIVICIRDKTQKEHFYILRNKGVFHLKFELFNQDDKRLLTMVSSNKWLKTSYDYSIESVRPNFNIELAELLIYCGYSANLYLTMISAI
ncbi:aminotransferase [Euzebyella marina]|uniref:Aminotransferase n=1 Tax=Euzebyella marina TaxID=1761453 RepID=A0A3G2LBE4_9FLAO|nr:aminotransferase [Euzebyella marina]AYN69574.1 aminotransferase [Euzebyella marina]